ncbi:MAG: class I SAM-dependent DNA methyltransferase, partial [Candidatus Zixiibacteriota bacterium]
RHGLDLCCGTGSAALAFADAGYTVRGVDGSPYMLRRARAKRRAAPVRIASRVVFGPGVMPDFRANSALKASAHTASLDFVTCYYDSLNYLLRENDLRATFRTVAELLKPGGLFVFDMNSNHALKVMWGKSTYAGAGENMAWIWKNRYLPRSKTAEVEAIFFKRNGKANTWRRFSEAHTERAYKISAVRRLLRESALAPLAAYRCFTFTAASEKNFRHCYVARRKDRN